MLSLIGRHGSAPVSLARNGVQWRFRRHAVGMLWIEQLQTPPKYGNVMVFSQPAGKRQIEDLGGEKSEHYCRLYLRGTDCLIKCLQGGGSIESRRNVHVLKRILCDGMSE